MADGIPCKHCGHQESSHDVIRDDRGKIKLAELQAIGGSQELQPECQSTLENCPGYVAEE